ncbi:sugar phosphate nucleotidyltransferase [Haloplanus aerogenes]|uniref:Bifunctional protein GlmU n=1 Tax=Haloplanus aerogenes TaxID=660522 RepID=A0A3M0DV69_9EURY|nr:sugar phosphate nucleotidyltransferase [Haloplanus aerogenes]AZH24770.1 glucose-1-phosphate thymidylyltransferase [Haloplanus aerogenes]RMB23566.1 glucose-1-phosphate thymidylyltransferase [Haloplanus aerogenes]
MKAVVLAAGKGRRLWPLTENRPKPMLPVANRPILEHIIDALVQTEITEVILVVGSNRDRIQSHFEDIYAGLDISYVVQETQLGTGHALLQAESRLGEYFIALNGDRIIDTAVIDAVIDRREETNRPVMAITRIERPSRYGVVELEGQTVVGLEEQPHPDLTKSDYINAGVYAFGPEIFAGIRRIETHGEQALTDALATFIDDRRLEAVRYQGTWLDVSEPWDLLTVNNALLRDRSEDAISESATIDTSAVVRNPVAIGENTVIHPQAVVLDGVSLGDNVSIGAGSILKNTIILSDVTIKSGTVMTDCIVGANTTLGPNTTVEGGHADVVLSDTVHHDVTLGGLIGDNVAGGGNVTITPGTIVGNTTTLDSGTYVSGRIDDGSHVQRG